MDRKATAGPSAFSEFPVRPGGVGRLHAAFLKESRIRGRCESSVVGNPEYARDDKWRVVTFIRGCRIGWTEKQQQVPRLSQDFLSGLVALVDFMRLSLKKAAYGRTTARLT
jgi:hypothetical protein